MPTDLLGALLGITLFTLVLCVTGVGLFILPLVALLWILYFVGHLTLGAGIAIGGIAIACAICFVLTSRLRQK